MADLSGFTEKTEITIKNPEGNPELTDYPARVLYDTQTPYGEGKIRVNCRDLRVTDSDGLTLLPFWIETSLPAGSPVVDYESRIWVKLPSIPADGGTKTIYIYHGSPGASPPGFGNGDKTFRFFDNFEGWTRQRSDFSVDEDGWEALSGVTVSREAGPIADGQVDVLQVLGGVATTMVIGDDSTSGDWAPTQEGGDTDEFHLVFEYFAEAGCGLKYLGLKNTKDSVTSRFGAFAVKEGFWDKATIDFPGWFEKGEDPQYDFQTLRIFGFENPELDDFTLSFLADGKRFWIKNIEVKEGQEDYMESAHGEPVGMRPAWDIDKWRGWIYTGDFWPWIYAGARFEAHYQIDRRTTVYGEVPSPVRSAVEHRMAGVAGEPGWGPWWDARLGGIGRIGTFPLSLVGVGKKSTIKFKTGVQETNIVLPDTFYEEDHVYSVYMDENDAQFLIDYEEKATHTISHPQSPGDGMMFGAASTPVPNTFYDVFWARIRDRYDPEPFDPNWIPVDSFTDRSLVKLDIATPQFEGEKTDEGMVRIPVDVLQREGEKDQIVSVHMKTGFWYQLIQMAQEGLPHVITGLSLKAPKDLRSDGTLYSAVSVNPVLSAVQDSWAEDAIARAYGYQVQVASKTPDFSSPFWDSGQVDLTPYYIEKDMRSYDDCESDLEEGILYWQRWRMEDSLGRWSPWAVSCFTLMTKGGLLGLFHAGGDRGIARVLANLLVGIGYATISGNYLLTEDGQVILIEDGTLTLVEP